MKRKKKKIRKRNELTVLKAVFPSLEIWIDYDNTEHYTGKSQDKWKMSDWQLTTNFPSEIQLIALVYDFTSSNSALNARQTIHFEIRFVFSSEAYRKWWEWERRKKKKRKEKRKKGTREETIVNFSILFYIMHIEFEAHIQCNRNVFDFVQELDGWES